MDFRRDAIGGVEAEFRACLAEFGLQLGRCDNGDVEDLAGFEQLLRGGDDFGELVDGAAEFLLEIADAVRSSLANDSTGVAFVHVVQ